MTLPAATPPSAPSDATPEGAGLKWQPIETAPRDGTRILLFRNGYIVCGSWNDDRCGRKPRPYWSHDYERIFGTLEARQLQPSHWMPLPPPPTPAPAVEG